MAGGMDRRGHRSPSLAERTSGATAVAAARPTRAAPGAESATGRAGVQQRHCWVMDALAPGRRAAGLLVEWRQLDGVWQGRVAYVVDTDGEATLVETWLPASQLQRATG